MNLITTERLAISHFSEDDAEFILKLLNSPGWTEYIGNKNISTPEDAENYIRDVLISMYRRNGFGLYLVKLKEDNIPVGMCGLVKRDRLNDVDIGFALLPEYSGKGYAFESAKAVLDYARMELGIKKIVAVTNKDNYNSIRLLEKLGLKFERLIIFFDEGKELMLFS